MLGFVQSLLVFQQEDYPGRFVDGSQSLVFRSQVLIHPNSHDKRKANPYQKYKNRACMQLDMLELPLGTRRINKEMDSEIVLLQFAFFLDHPQDIFLHH